MKSYLVAQLARNNSMHKNTMRIFVRMEDLIVYLIDNVIGTRFHEYRYVDINYTLGGYMYRIYEFETNKDIKPKLISKELGKHFTIGDIK